MALKKCTCVSLQLSIRCSLGSDAAHARCDFAKMSQASPGVGGLCHVGP